MSERGAVAVAGDVRDGGHGAPGHAGRGIARGGGRSAGPSGDSRARPPDDDLDLLTADEVIRLLRLKALAPRSPREALRNLVRRGSLECLRQGPGKHGRMVFLRRHVRECLERWQQWGRR